MVDSSDAQKSISSTGEKAEGLGNKLKSGIATAAKWATGIATAAASVGTAMVAAAKNTADALGGIDDAAQRMGVDAETLQELEYVAKMSGLELSNLEKAAKKLEGTDLNLDQAIDQIMALGTAEEQTAAAIEMFGENIAYTLQPLLNHGAEGIEAFKEQARELGIILSNDAVESGASFGDMFDALSSSFESMKNTLFADLMPYAMQIMQWLMDNLPMIQETLKAVIDTIIPIVQPILDMLMQIIPPVFDKVKELLDWLTPYLQPIMDAVVDVVEGVMMLLNGDVEGFIESIKNALITLGKALYGIGKDIVTYLWKGIKEIWNSVSTWVSQKVEWLKEKLMFWKNSTDTMNASEVDGSHASGLNYVPYDGYVAELHRGESVMTAGNVQGLMQKLTELIENNQNATMGPIELTLNIDGQAFARATYEANQNEILRRGTSLVGVL